ncbi:MAG: hypothetical protein ACI4TK_07310 [Agathobacter sp.]
MKAESFIQILNDIPDAYIDEYGELQENRQRKKNYRGWGILAACLAVCILLFVPTISHLMNKAQIEDPRGGFTHSFSSYGELCEILPEESILRNIPTEKYTITECKGTCLYNSDGDVSKYENYSYLYIVMRCKDTGESVQIKFVPAYHETAEYYRATRMSDCPKEYYGFTTICDTDIYLAKTQNADHTLTSCAIWEIGTDIYEVKSGFGEQEPLITLIEELLR